MRKANMSKDEIIEYLTVELKTVIREDILPGIRIGQEEGGYFSTPRLVLTCVDYLGALYCGWNTTEVVAGKPNFTASRKAIKYLQDIFGEVFPDYRMRAKLLWEMYRHGTVHRNEPKSLQNGTRTIRWFLFKAGLTERMIAPRQGAISVNDLIIHLMPKETTPNN